MFDVMANGNGRCIYIEYYMVNVISARVSARGTGISPSPAGEGWYQTEGWDKGLRSHLPCNVVCIIYLKQRFGKENNQKEKVVNEIVPTFWLLRKLKEPPPPLFFPQYLWKIFVYELSPVKFRYDDTMQNYLYTIAMQITWVFLDHYL